MTKEVRWRLQMSQPGADVWKDSDQVYSGWFYGGVNDEPSETVLAQYQEAANTYHWLDVRLIQDTRSYTTRTIREIKREAKKEE